MTDARDLLRAYVQTKSEEAFARFVERHLGLVYVSALRRTGYRRQLAEEIAQEVFHEVARRAAFLAEHPVLIGWLYSYTRYVALHVMRSERRRVARECVAAELEGQNGPGAVAGQALMAFLDDAMDGLSATDRSAVLLRFFEERSFAEIGRNLRLSEEGARTRVNRAVNKLRAILERNGVKSTSAALAMALSESGAAGMVPPGLVGAIAGAIANASARTGAGALSVIFMTSASKIVTGAGLIAALVAGAFLLREGRQLWAERTALNRAEADFRQTLSQVEQARREFARMDAAAARAASHRLTSVARGPGSDSIPGASPGGLAAETQRRPTPPVNWSLSRDPAIRAALAAWMKSAFFAEYGKFYQLAHFSPQQIDALENLLLEKDINMGVAVLTLRPEGTDLGTVENQIHQFLGDSLFERFQEYSRTRFLRDIADGVASAVYDTATPLCSQEADQIIQILANSSAIYANGGAPFLGNVDWDAALPRAGAMLAPSQYAALSNEVRVLNAPAIDFGLNPALPGIYGDGITPPMAVFAFGNPKP